MKIPHRALFLFVPIFALTLSIAAPDNAKEVMTRNENARKVKDFEARSKLVTASNTGAATTKDFTLWRKIQSNGVQNNTLTRFHAPAEVRDEGILISENPSGQNDVLLYLPNFKKTRRVESKQQSGSFMGSVFSYSDIATPHVDEYNYKNLGTEKCQGDAKLTCTKIQATPATAEVKDRVGYTRSVLWIRPDNFMMERADYYQDDQLWKTLQASNIKQVDAQNNKWLAYQLKIRNVLTNESTTLEFTDVKANKGISDANFTQKSLEKAGI